MRVGISIRGALIGAALTLAACKPSVIITPSGFSVVEDDHEEWEDTLAGKIKPVEYSPDASLKWNTTQGAEAYRQHGRRSPVWDAPAIALMEQWLPIYSATSFAPIPGMPPLAEAARQVVALGCDDPLVRYVRIRYGGFDPAAGNNEIATEWDQVATDVLNSQYAPYRKFYASLRAAQYVQRALPPDMQRVQHFFDHAHTNLVRMATAPDTPEDVLYEAAASFWMTHKAVHDDSLRAWESADAALKIGRPGSFAQNVLKGFFFIDHAWAARGDNYANTVSADGWKLFYERLSEAEKALVTAWYQRPDDWRPANGMITVEIGQGRGRDRMEKWFERAMTASPINWDACDRKLIYLEPKWHGSEKDLLAFGRECASSTNWSGTISLYLIDAHDRVAGYQTSSQHYFQSSGVWADIKDCYESYLKLEPEDHNRKSRYALYAITCGQIGPAKEILTELGTNVVTSHFGGDQTYAALWTSGCFKDSGTKPPNRGPVE